MLKNKNRGYQQLWVWHDAVQFYRLTSHVFRKFPYELKRVGSQAIAASDSVHRNIAEGYCRRSLKEYLNFLYIALGSLGESVSGFHAYRGANQITDEEFKALNDLAFKLENRLLGWLKVSRTRNWTAAGSILWLKRVTAYMGRGGSN